MQGAGRASAFRTFPEAHWQAFGDVESKDPRIAELPWGVVILDGERLEVVLADDQVTCFSTGFFRRGVARLVAEHLAAMQNPTRAEIEQFLERI